jgi:hypothetical protein
VQYLAAGRRSKCDRPRCRDAEERLTKDDVAYQNTPKGRQRCDNCEVFLPPDGRTSVQGKISPRGWCNIWRQAKMER